MGARPGSGRGRQRGRNSNPMTPAIALRIGLSLAHYLENGAGEVAALGSITEEFFDKLFNINVKGLQPMRTMVSTTPISLKAPGRFT